ncbi:two-component response regulator ORR21-like [Malus domestica]|uniref:two-component response regulator ORR21-like n=1 Tax=Malus domestica TaxID=3750 RepID=UPI0039765F3F
MANISMPDKDKFSLLQVLHKNEIPVIFMSSEVNIDVAKKALAEGACFFLQKPVSSEDLKNVWQHAYRKVRNPRKDTHKTKCGKKIHEAGGVLIPPTGGIRIHEVGGVSRLPTGRELCLDTQDTRDERQIAAENYTQGALGINRPVDDKEDQEKAKKVKLNTEQDCDEEGMENQDCDGSSKRKKWHPVWTTELHLKFTAAISALGDQSNSYFS